MMYDEQQHVSQSPRKLGHDSRHHENCWLRLHCGAHHPSQSIDDGY